MLARFCVGVCTTRPQQEDVIDIPREMVDKCSRANNDWQDPFMNYLTMITFNLKHMIAQDNGDGIGGGYPYDHEEE